MQKGSNLSFWKIWILFFLTLDRSKPPFCIQNLFQLFWRMQKGSIFKMGLTLVQKGSILVFWRYSLFVFYSSIVESLTLTFLMRKGSILLFDIRIFLWELVLSFSLLWYIYDKTFLGSLGKMLKKRFLCLKEVLENILNDESDG